MAYTTDWKVTTPVVGVQPITEVSATARHPLGTIVRAKDPTYGEGEFIYLLGVASTVVGSCVTYNATTWQTTLSPTTRGSTPNFSSRAIPAT